MMWYGKKNVEPIWSMNTGRFPSIMRTFVHTSPASLGGRQVEQVAQQRLLVRDMDARHFGSRAHARAGRAARHRPDGPTRRSGTDRVSRGRSRSTSRTRPPDTQTPMPTCRSRGS